MTAAGIRIAVSGNGGAIAHGVDLRASENRIRIHTNGLAPDAASLLALKQVGHLAGSKLGCGLAAASVRIRQAIAVFHRTAAAAHDRIGCGVAANDLAVVRCSQPSAPDGTAFDHAAIHRSEIAGCIQIQIPDAAFGSDGAEQAACQAGHGIVSAVKAAAVGPIAADGGPCPVFQIDIRGQYRIGRGIAAVDLRCEPEQLAAIGDLVRTIGVFGALESIAMDAEAVLIDMGHINGRIVILRIVARAALIDRRTAKHRIRIRAYALSPDRFGLLLLQQVGHLAGGKLLRGLAASPVIPLKQIVAPSDLTFKLRHNGTRHGVAAIADCTAGVVSSGDARHDIRAGNSAGVTAIGDLPLVQAGDAADVNAAADRCAAEAFLNGALVVSGDAADVVSAADNRVPQLHIFHNTVFAHIAEQTPVAGFPGAAKLGNGMALSIEPAGEGLLLGAHGRPFPVFQMDIRRQNCAGRGVAAVDQQCEPEQLAAVGDFINSIAVRIRSTLVSAADHAEAVLILMIGPSGVCVAVFFLRAVGNIIDRRAVQSRIIVGSDFLAPDLFLLGCLQQIGNLAGGDLCLGSAAVGIFRVRQIVAVFHHAPVLPGDLNIGAEAMEDLPFIDSGDTADHIPHRNIDLADAVAHGALIDGGDAADAVRIAENSLHDHSLHQALWTDGAEHSLDAFHTFAAVQQFDTVALSVKMSTVALAGRTNGNPFTHRHIRILIDTDVIAQHSAGKDVSAVHQGSEPVKLASVADFIHAVGI